jgi:hypothetical protein
MNATTPHVSAAQQHSGIWNPALLKYQSCYMIGAARRVDAARCAQALGRSSTGDEDLVRFGFYPSADRHPGARQYDLIASLAEHRSA